MDQLRLDIPEEDLKRQRRRRRTRTVARTRPRKTPVTVPLIEAPVLQQCGFCGHAQTVERETAVCDECGGIIMRDESDE